jgi:hypothetical protein
MGMGMGMEFEKLKWRKHSDKIMGIDLFLIGKCPVNTIIYIINLFGSPVLS